MRAGCRDAKAALQTPMATSPLAQHTAVGTLLPREEHPPSHLAFPRASPSPTCCCRVVTTWKRDSTVKRLPEVFGKCPTYRASSHSRAAHKNPHQQASETCLLDPQQLTTSCCRKTSPDTLP